MTITLTSGAPTANATGLTVGGNYSVWHTAGVTVTAAVGTGTVALYSAGTPGGVVLSGIPAATLTFTLGPGTTAAQAEITALP